MTLDPAAAQWVQLGINILGTIFAVWLGATKAVSALDKRLSVMETKMEIAIKASEMYVTRAEVTLLGKGADAEHVRLQTQIEELKSQILRIGRPI